MANKNIQKYIEYQKRLKNDPEFAEAERNKKREGVKEYWKKLKPFVNSHDVPSIPKFDVEWFQNRLIELGAIPLEQLEVGEWYYGNNRNTTLGKWNGDNFDHLRYSFNYYWDTSEHFQKDDGFALFTPIRKAKQEEIDDILTKIDKEGL